MEKLQALMDLLKKLKAKLLSVENLISAADRTVGLGVRVVCGSGEITFKHSDDGVMLLIHNEKRRLIAEIEPIENRIAILEELATETLKNL